MPQDKIEVMRRAAQSFDDKGFLPSIADIREFCRIHGVDLGKSISRANAILLLKTLATITLPRAERDVPLKHTSPRSVANFILIFVFSSVDPESADGLPQATPK